MYNSGGTADHSAKLAVELAAGYLMLAGERDTNSLRELHVIRTAIMPHLKDTLPAFRLWSDDVPAKALYT